MSRNFFGIEKGLELYAENGGLLIRFLSGTAVPDGLLDQAAAPIGSIYFRSGTNGIYEKVLNNGNAADWELNGAAAASIGKWREEKVVVVTNDTVSVGVRDLTASPFADDNGTLITAADFVVGNHIIADADGTPVLLKVTAVASPDVTFAAADAPMVAEDTFIAINYLPDADGGENRAIVNFNGSVMVKISDVDWSLATGINLSSGYAAAAGNPVAGDTLESAVAKIDGNVDALNTLSGVAQGATNLGSWTSPVDLLFSATSTVKALFQRIGDLLMQFRGVQVASITTATMVDQVPVATVKAVKWFVTAFEIATPANAHAFEVYALNNGTLVDDNLVSKLKVGSNFNLTTNVDISGGNMRLMIASTTGGVTVTARRIEVVKSVL